MKVNGKHFRTVSLEGHRLHLINQPLLPHRFEIVTTSHHAETADAITTMVVRGAGAIGATAAAGMAQAALEAPESGFDDYMAAARDRIHGTRPTAQNLFYGVDRVMTAIAAAEHLQHKRDAAVEAAQQVADEDALCCKRIGEHGAKLIQDGMRLSTAMRVGSPSSIGEAPLAHLYGPPRGKAASRLGG